MSVPAPFGLTPRWPLAPLKRVARLGTGHTPDRKRPELWENCTIPWITTGEVSQMRDDRIERIYETRESISELGVQNSAAVIHPAGTVVLSRTASAGFSAIMGSDMATSQDFVTWTCGPRLRPEYLLWCLRAMRPYLLGQLAMGSTHKTIYMPDLEALQVPLPPIEQQDRALERLRSELAEMDTVEAQLQRIRRLLADRQESLIEDIVFRGAGLVTPLKHVTDPSRPIQYGIVLPGPDVEGGIPIVKGGDVEHGRLRRELLKRTTSEIEAAYVRSRLRGGDLVISIRGSAGAVGLVPDELTGANLTQDAARIAPLPHVRSDWLLFALRSSLVQRQVRSMLVGATIKGINIEDLRRVEVPLPCLEDQERNARELAAAHEAHVAAVDAVDRQIGLLAERRQVLITEAVTGKLDVSGVAA